LINFDGVGKGYKGLTNVGGVGEGYLGDSKGEIEQRLSSIFNQAWFLFD